MSSFNTSFIAEKDAVRGEIDRKLQEFLAKGGKVKTVERVVADVKKSAQIPTQKTKRELRINDLLNELRQNGSVSAEAFAAKYNITVATLTTDVNVLRGRGIKIAAVGVVSKFDNKRGRYELIN